MKKVNEFPRVTDEIEFEILCPDSDGCFVANPYKVDSLKIYYVERDFHAQNFGVYDRVAHNDKLLSKVKSTKALACAYPTDDNITAANLAQAELEESSIRSTFYYSDAIVVFSLGEPLNPVWLSSDTSSALIEHVEYDEHGNPQFGVYKYVWRPDGQVRPGDYFACWTWSPHPAGDSLSQNICFSLLGDPRIFAAIPSHITPKDKYGTLLNRYTPEMYFDSLSDDDITSDMVNKLNQAIGDGFTMIDDQVNQLIDLLDSNVLQESMLVYLANMFNLRLKSDDPTLWRRQIKEAVPLFKQKGTLRGLAAAFAQAGMKLNKFTQLWQVTSPYTYEESFLVQDDGEHTFQLSHVALHVDLQNFGLWVRKHGDSVYEPQPASAVALELADCGLYSEMIWSGEELSRGDIIRVRYSYNEIPDGTAQGIEEYIQQLSLADRRDEVDISCPKKNWNVRLIEEDDPLFSTIVSVRHPFADDVVFGRVRTEFPYSENIYNMEEYNGSTRDSTDPCYIDCGFVDACGACVSSKFNIDIAVEELGDIRVAEIRDILRENVPLHAVPHNITFQGEVTEFVPSPIEDIKCYITQRYNDFCVSGSANTLFSRITLNEDGCTYNLAVSKDDLSSESVVYTGSGTAFNDRIVFLSHNVKLDTAQVIPNSHVLHVLPPSPNSGAYTIGNATGNFATLTSSLAEPVNPSLFTFNLTNVNYKTSIASISQDDLTIFRDDEHDILSAGLQTSWPSANIPGYPTNSWSVELFGATYQIQDALPDGGIVLQGTPSLGGNLPYRLLDDNGEEVLASSSGQVQVIRRGLVTLAGLGVPASRHVRSGDFLYYNGIEYNVIGASDVNETLHISGYNLGSAGNVYVECRRRLMQSETGAFDYHGMKLVTQVDHEVELGILNGSNPPYSDPNMVTDDNRFKENYLVKIGNDYFRIEDIDGMVITLGGPRRDWGTQAAGGSNVGYSIIHLQKQGVSVGLNVFNKIDRSGKEPIRAEVYDDVSETVTLIALQADENTGIEEHVHQTESISFKIEYRDGTTEEGEVECS